MQRDRVTDVAFIVSAYDRPKLLRTCLWSLACQTYRDFAVLVTDNADDPRKQRENRAAVASIQDHRFAYVSTADIEVSDCYWSSEHGIKHTNSRWLCFPCDDTYYPPEWLQRMLNAAYRENLDLVLCANAIAAPITCGTDHYFQVHLGTESFPGYKPSFIVKRDKFTGWINKPTTTACSGVDRTTLQGMVKHLAWGVARDLYYVHN